MEKDVYISTWRNKWITSDAKNIDDFIKAFEELAKMFKEWKERGIELYDDGGVGEKPPHNFTTELLWQA